MTHALLARIIIFGWAVSLLVLSAGWPGPAKAFVMSIEESAAVVATASEAVARPIDATGVRDSDQQALLADDLAAGLDPANVVCRALPRCRLAVPGGNTTVDKPDLLAVFTIGAAGSDMTNSPGPRGVPAQNPILAPGIDSGVALDSPNPNRATAVPARPDNVLRDSADQYDAISLDVDVAAAWLTGAYKAISLDIDTVTTGLLGAADRYKAISLDGNAADTGLGAADRYNAISVDGDAADKGLGAIDRYKATGIKDSGAIGIWLDYIAACERFLFSRDVLPYLLIIAIVYVAFEGTRKLIGALR